MASRHCPVCGDGNHHALPLYMLPNALRELGYQNETWAHVNCVTSQRSLLVKTAARRGMKFEDVVAERRV